MFAILFQTFQPQAAQLARPLQLQPLPAVQVCFIFIDISHKQ